ncbi:MAG: hypothetical protein QM820_35180 [Minicystis sp.]
MSLVNDEDRYEAYYSDKLWGLLPEIYRALDSSVPDEKGPLRELCDRIGVQAAILRRSIDRTWEDQSIESCDDWVIPYIADLLATKVVASLDARGQRLDVANTIYYRRRKGTLSVLEELAADITGWDARAVELFRRMGRARHNLDFEIGYPAPADDAEAQRAQAALHTYGPHTRTPAYGIADLRSPHVARLTGTAFDELSYTADVRAAEGRTGWYNVPRLGVFLRRLRAYPVESVTPVTCTGCSGKFSFDPTGREIPLFARSTRKHGDDWIAPAEHELAGPIDRLLFTEVYADLWATVDEQNNHSILPRSLGVYQPDGTGALVLVPEDEITGKPEESTDKAYVDPEEGLLFLTTTQVARGAPEVSYHYGFSSDIGAGTYTRIASPPGVALTLPSVSGGGYALGTTLSGAGGRVLVNIDDSRTYISVPDLTVGGLTLRAKSGQRPLIRLPDSAPFTTVWTLAGATVTSRLTLDGIFVSGGEILLVGNYDEVTIVTSTLDPGTAGASAGTYVNSVDSRPLAPCRLRVNGHVNKLVIDRSIVGSVAVEATGTISSLRISESIVQSHHGEFAVDAGPLCDVEIVRSTILGPGRVHRLQATSSILYGAMEVADKQHSCLRYCAYTTDGSLPHKFECHALDAGASVFTSRVFGEPAYAQLSASAPPRLWNGAEDGAEMGAFGREKTPIKERSLLIKLNEYMPAGLTPVLIYTT